MSRSFYLVLPNWEDDLENPHEAVVATLPHGPRYLNIGLELWQLVDSQERVAGIKKLHDCAYERERPILDVEEVKELDALLDGLDDAVKAAWLDDKWKVPSNLLPEVRRRTTLLDLQDEQGHLASEGVSEGLSQVHELRDFLKQALDKGLHLALD
jgi:hypothetical protein